MIFTAAFQNAGFVFAYEYGDFDGSGDIEYNDASLILDYVLSPEDEKFKDYNADNYKRAKVTSGKDITARDAAEVLRKAADKSFKFSANNGEADNPKPETDFSKIVYSGTTWLMGDSTVCEYGPDRAESELWNYREGWGMELGTYLPKGTNLKNKALSGRSLRSMLTESNYTDFINGIKAGDYFIMQFGHNDNNANSDWNAPSREDKLGVYAIPFDTLKEKGLIAEDDWINDDDGMFDNISGTGEKQLPCFEWFMYYKYLKPVIDAGAVPVLCTPITRASQDKNDKNIFNGPEINTKHQLYADTTKKVAERFNIEYIDLLDLTTKKWTEVYNGAGANGSEELKKLHAIDYKGANVDNFPDRTHLSKEGAKIVAEFVAKGLKDLNYDISSKLQNLGGSTLPETDLSKIVYSGTTWLMGDSTVCNYDKSYDNEKWNYREGWGMELGAYLPAGSTVNNQAISGISSRDMLTKGSANYNKFAAGIKKGDYLIMQFGHNDSKTNGTMDGPSSDGDKDRYTIPWNSIKDKVKETDWYGDEDGLFTNTSGSGEESIPCYEWFLYYKYVKPVIDAGGVPVLCTPITRSKSGLAGVEISEKHNLYAAAVRGLAERFNLPCIDLLDLTTKKWTEVYNAEGVDGLKKLHAIAYKGEGQTNDPDRTHLSKEGAKIVAGFVANGLKDLNYDISSKLQNPDKEPEELKPLDFSEVTVDASAESNESTKTFKTVNEALDFVEKYEAPKSESERITIKIKKGTYREQIIVNTPYITFENADSENYNDVVLTWYYGIGYKYYSIGADGYYNKDEYDKNKAAKTYTAPAKNWGHTVRVNSSDFTAKNITFENSFNYYITQEEIDDGVVPVDVTNADEKSKFYSDGTATKPARASLAVNTDVSGANYVERACVLYFSGADKGIVEGCYLKSAQDTLGTAGRGYYKNCVIEGVTDYICGSGFSVFEDCELRWHNSAKTKTGVITAPQESYLFKNCKVTGPSGSGLGMVYGRPWRDPASAVMYKTRLANSTDSGNASSLTITGRGWTDMSSRKAEDAAFFEYGTVKDTDGSAVDLSGRLKLKKESNKYGFSNSVITDAWDMIQFNAYNYTKGADNWDPSGVGAKVKPIQDALNALNIAENNENVVLENEIYKVSGNFTLPAVGAFEVKYVSNSANVVINGTNAEVKRPIFGSEPESVVLKVYARENDSDEFGDVKEIKLSIIPDEPENAQEALELVAGYVKENFENMYSKNESGELVVVSSMNLPEKDDKYSTYTLSYSSSDETVLKNDGLVTRPEFSVENPNKSVTLTCTVTDAENNTKDVELKISVPCMPFGNWENFESANIGDINTKGALWNDTTNIVGTEGNSLGVTDKIGLDYQPSQGKFYQYKVTSSPGNPFRALAYFFSGDATDETTQRSVTTTDSISELTFKVYASKATPKTEIYFHTTPKTVDGAEVASKTPLLPQVNSGQLILPTTASQYEDGVAPSKVIADGLNGQWYTVKVVMDTTAGDTKFVSDIYVYDESGKEVGKSLAIPKYAKNETTKYVTDVFKIEFRPDRNLSTHEVYFDDLGYIDYKTAVTEDGKYIESLISSADSIDNLPAEGPRGTKVTYTGTLDSGTVTVSKGYYGGDTTIGYKKTYTITNKSLAETN